MLGFLLSPTGGWVTSAPRKMTGSLKTFGLIEGTRMELTPPSFTLILRQRFERVWGEVLLTFLAWTHCVAIPSKVSPTLFTSAYTGVLPGSTTTTSCRVGKELLRYLNIGSTWSGPPAYLQKQGWPMIGIPGEKDE